ncbi:SDR family NAD(P)-dependent oxidoreductase [Ectobacillus antri]|jgi:short-subunit dehydrogenase|uniref:SDR family NAD(P)-dependent oxidoreductase n=1 Tax=Ectobacillus antri TaxID=2486280 RepID=A0ABT6H2Q1_9BACI|nr:SDR family NAD(P)-dependent oxidoreductase [Ectobacillus antri]MDG4658083.1 SDR family NAD(P)-dependent oxidoreductase [Ectobacillus antri]MDG5753676.1 SDR family NAD(P)-dependent oxidoreductase [Ectobacillus antri]
MKYTVITGASSGIGYEAALAFAARGKNLIIAARRTEQLEELKKAVYSAHPNVDVIIRTTDLSVSTNVHAFYNSLKNYEIETFINNAGFGNFASVGEQNLDKIETMLHLNIEALTILSSLFVRDYAHVPGTQLINISSGGGYTIVGNAVTYCATKFYVSAFTEGIAHELKEQNAAMQAKVLAPAATETEFAKRASDLDSFVYKGVVPKFHTAKEMAHFLLALYDSDKVVGIVDGITYEFELRDPIFHYVNRTR